MSNNALKLADDNSEENSSVDSEMKTLDERLHVLENLSKLEQLCHLDHLKSLKDLNKLDKLNHLIRLGHLKKLEELQALDQLKELQSLDKLSQLNKLDALIKIENLEALNKIEDLRLLMQDHSKDFQKLDNLKHIESLDNLTLLSSLTELDKLVQLQDLSKLDKLSSLERLEALSALDKLNKLDELKHLERIEGIQELGKLDYLKDPKVQSALKGLDKLSLFQESSKTFFFRLISSILVDVIKVAAIAGILLLIFTKNISRQTFDRLTPYLGFGEADRVNIALSILSHDLSKNDFDEQFKNLEFRVRREVASVFNTKTEKNLDHYRMLENLTAYNYQQGDYDLMAFTKKEIDEWASKTQKIFEDSNAYDNETLSESKDLAADYDRFTKGSIFIKQQKFIEGFVEMNQIVNKSKFASLGAGLTYSFYMAFRTKPIDLKLYLEK